MENNIEKLKKKLATAKKMKANYIKHENGGLSTYSDAFDKEAKGLEKKILEEQVRGNLKKKGLAVKDRPNKK